MLTEYTEYLDDGVINPTHVASKIPLSILESQPQPSLVDMHKVRQRIEEVLTDLHSVSSALTLADRTRIHSMLNIEDMTYTPGEIRANMDVDEVTRQYLLVLKIRNMVLDPNQQIAKGDDVKALSSLVSSINSLISLWIRSQEKVDHMREVSHMREAVIAAISEQSAEVREIFFAKLKELENA